MGALTGWLHEAFHVRETRAYRVTQSLVWILILISILLLGLESILPEDLRAAEVVALADRFLLTIFAIEIILRVGTFRPPALDVFKRPPLGHLHTHLVGRLKFLTRPQMLIDLLAVLALFPELRGLRVLRLLRLLRTSSVFQYRNPFAIVFQAFEENRLLFTLAFVVLGVVTLLGGATIFLVESRVNPQIASFGDGLWWALVTVTTVGFGDISVVTGLGRIVGAGLMVGGMFTLALFAGIVGASLVNSMLSIREEQFRMSDYVNHIVVCGWDDSTHLMLDALQHELKLQETRVVLFDCHERPKDLPPAFLWVQGDPTKESELDKVRLTHAAGVIVTGERDTTPQAADAKTILITFTIRAYMQSHAGSVRHRRSPLYLVAEVLDSENVDHAKMAGADEVIESQRIGYSMIAHAVRYHGSASAMSRVLMYGAHNVYVGLVPEEGIRDETFGELLARMQLSKRGGLVVGLRTPAGQEVINPSKAYRMEPGTQLLYLAELPLLKPPG